MNNAKPTAWRRMDLLVLIIAMQLGFLLQVKVFSVTSNIKYLAALAVFCQGISVDVYLHYRHHNGREDNLVNAWIVGVLFVMSLCSFFFMLVLAASTQSFIMLTAIVLAVNVVMHFFEPG